MVNISIDGAGRLTTNSGEKRDILCQGLESEQFTLPADTKVVTVKAHNSNGKGGILASFSNGVVTDKSWQCADMSLCTSKDCSRATWQSPVTLHKVKRQGKRSIKVQSAQWIWASEKTAERVWCRKTFGK